MDATTIGTPPSVPPLRIGMPAPDFCARSTHGDIRLSDLRGRWVLLFSHPADFTPVCSTEFVALARRCGDFSALDCQLIGLSVDSLYAHLAWARELEALFEQPITFPILEDPTMAIGRAYGMIDETSADSTTMRSSFFIDPAGTIRAITCYPHNVGRSVDEMLRLLRALIEADRRDVLTGEGWQPGEPCLIAPQTDYRGADWFCRCEPAR